MNFFYDYIRFLKLKFVYGVGINFLNDKYIYLVNLCVVMFNMFIRLKKLM